MSTLTINIDEKLKKKAQKRAKREGFTLTSLVAQFFKDYTQGKVLCGLHLKLKDEILESSKELEEEIKRGEGKSYSSVEEMNRDILGEDYEVQYPN